MYKVMIVEDEEILQTGLMYLIDWQAANCVVTCVADNGQDALEKLPLYTPDIVILDINMPIMNGITFLEKSQSIMQFSSIIVSGYDEFSYAKKAISYDVVEYLLKPLEEELLLKALEKAIEKIEKKRGKAESNVVTITAQQLHDNLIVNTPIQNQEVAIILSYIEENYQEKISIEDIIPILNRGKTYLNKKFREEVGHSFNEQLNRYRVSQAIKQIRQTNKTIATIAEDVGFNNYKYFIEVFKKYTTVLPKDFLNFQEIISTNDE